MTSTFWIGFAAGIAFTAIVMLMASSVVPSEAPPHCIVAFAEAR